MIDQMKRHWSWNLDEGVIAGGWIRDTLLGIPPRDLDIFIHYDSAWNLYQSIRVRMARWEKEPYLTVPNRSIRSIQLDAVSDYTPGVPILTANRGITWAGEEVNIIITKDILERSLSGIPLPSSTDRGKSIIKNFDYTVNGFAWDNYDKKFSHVKHAFTDLVHRKLRLIEGSTSTPSEERAQYMRRKNFR